MRMVRRRRITALILSALMVFSVTFTLASPRAQANTVKDVLKQLEQVYDQLVLDTGGKNDVAAAKANLSNLNRDPDSAPWPECIPVNDICLKGGEP